MTDAYDYYVVDDTSGLLDWMQQTEVHPGHVADEERERMAEAVEVVMESTTTNRVPVDPPPIHTPTTVSDVVHDFTEHITGELSQAGSAVLGSAVMAKDELLPDFGQVAMILGIGLVALVLANKHL